MRKRLDDTTKEELQAKIREFEEILAADEERCMAGRRQCRAINQRVVPFTFGAFGNSFSV